MKMNIISDSMIDSYENDRDISNKSKQWKYVKKSTNASNRIKTKMKLFPRQSVTSYAKENFTFGAKKEYKIIFFQWKEVHDALITWKNEKKH